MDVDDVTPNLLVTNPRGELLKVSAVYGPNHVTAQLVYPVPPRTTVRRHTAAHVAEWTQPNDSLVAAYEQAWGFTPARTA